jgi:hypothetical protein
LFKLTDFGYGDGLVIECQTNHGLQLLLLYDVSVRNSCPSVRLRQVTFQSGKQLSRVPCPADRQLFGQFASLDTSGQATFNQGKQLCSRACPAG